MASLAFLHGHLKYTFYSFCLKANTHSPARSSSSLTYCQECHHQPFAFLIGGLRILVGPLASSAWVTASPVPMTLCPHLAVCPPPTSLSKGPSPFIVFRQPPNTSLHPLVPQHTIMSKSLFENAKNVNLIWQFPPSSKKY